MENLNSPLPWADEPLAKLRQIVARLRAPGGCPWDREQTHSSLRAALVEETYETLAAIDAGDDANLREELGDLLLHVVMHSQMAAERGAFDFDAVAAEVGEKMIRRHPHVFGGDRAADSAAVLQRWDEIKRQEKGGAGKAGGVMSGLLAGLPALLRAQKAQGKAARVGFDWPAEKGVMEKVREEVAETEAALRGEGGADAVADELGDLLFSAVNLARWRKLEAELLLNRATDKFVRRFQGVEAALQAAGRRWEEVSPAELEAMWETIKTAETASGQ